MHYNDSYIDLLIQRCLDRTATADERKVLLRVLKYTDNEHIETKVVTAFKQEQVKIQPSEAVWGAIEKQMAQDTTIIPISSYSRIFKLSKYVAAVLLLLTIPLYFFREALPPAVTELKLVQEVSYVFKRQTPHATSEEFVEEVQLKLSQDRKVNLLAKDLSALVNAEKYIQISHTNNQIRYTLQDSAAQLSSNALVYHTIKVPYGKRYSVKLLDGTVVSLNSGTELRYPVNTRYGDMDLYLTGEAYFDVVKSQGRKFNVHVSGNSKKKEHVIQVLGTQFNIKSFPQDKESVTTLFEGEIQVSGLAKLPIQLQPSQQIAVGQSFTLSDADVVGALAWRNGVFYFKYSPLEQVCSELERWYGVPVRYYKGPFSKKLLAQISREKTLEELLDMLAQTYNVKYQYNGKEVILRD